MKAIVSVLGKDKKGIIAKVSTALYEEDVNIMDISQTIMQSSYFTMIMAVELPENVGIEKISEKMNALSKDIGVEIRIQHEDNFNSMHRI
ncbi:MAG: ACT domain-containing protein [Clostridia bacterium]|nr:ACT domain-containing protein [Clostridia bacterium]